LQILYMELHGFVYGVDQKRSLTYWDIDLYCTSGYDTDKMEIRAV
jgi:hypothetical protein